MTRYQLASILLPLVWLVAILYDYLVFTVPAPNIWFMVVLYLFCAYLNCDLALKTIKIIRDYIAYRRSVK